MADTLSRTTGSSAVGKGSEAIRRLLFISHRVPYPPDKGDRVRAFHEIEALSKHFRVTLAALAHDRSHHEVALLLEGMCDKVILAPAGGKIGFLRGAWCMARGRSVTEGYFHSSRMRRLLIAESHQEPFDLVFAYSSGTLPYALAISAPARVIDMVDVDSAKWASYAEASFWPKSWLYRREAQAVCRLEEKAVRKCDAVLLVSEVEVAALGAGGEHVVAVANGVDADFFAPGLVEPIDLGPASLVFTGTMDYRPNVEGVCWFARQVWQGLKQRVPKLTFTIVGRDPAPAVQRLAETAGITVTGAVPDVRPFLAAASVAICPLQIARGIQNKILEAMAMERAVVTSPVALEGLDAEDGKHVVQADSPAEWQEHILNLITNDDFRRELGKRARRHVQDRYTWAGRMDSLVTLCRRLCQTGTGTDVVGLGESRPDRADRQHLARNW